MENIFNDIKFGPEVVKPLLADDFDELILSIHSKTGTGNYQVGDCITYIGESDEYVIEGNSYEVVEVDYSDETVRVLDEEGDSYWLDFDQVEY